MRILDIGVATGYGLLCLSLIAVMNPYLAGIQAATSASDMHADEAIFRYVQSVGLVFLGDAPPAQVCASLGAHSNSTLILGGEVGGVTCPGAPTAYEGRASATLSLSAREDTIQAWDEEQ